MNTKSQLPRIAICMGSQSDWSTMKAAADILDQLCAAHLPGMIAAHTHLPVLGVPIESAALKGMDSLLSIVQMPAGVPVGTLAIGVAGAKNAALLAVQILALSDADLGQRIIAWRQSQTDNVAEAPE